MNILDPQGPIGVAGKTILIDSLAIMLATIVAIFAFAYWFRASNGGAFYWPNWEYSGRIELVVWSIPALTVILLGGVAWIGSHQLDPAAPVQGTGSPIRIQVVSLDWKWLFIYPEQGIATVNALTVPAGAPLHFELTSGSVMTAFFIPQLPSWHLARAPAISGRRAAESRADFGERDERVLHPAARQHDLHHERHGHAAEAPRRQ